MKHERFECTCISPHHTFRVTTWDDDTMSVSVALNRYLPLWRRIVVAVMYVIGIEVDAEHYDSVELNLDDRKRLKEIL